MARPRRWEYGDGCVFALTPHPDHLVAVKAGDITLAEYKRRWASGVCEWVNGISIPLQRHGFTFPTLHELSPGQLSASDAADNDFIVADGDTLCCACSRAAAAKGECHRVWAADLLKEAGWRVVLDGVEL